MKALGRCVALLSLWLVSACATLQVEPLPEPIRPPKSLPAKCRERGKHAAIAGETP